MMRKILATTALLALMGASAFAAPPTTSGSLQTVVTANPAVTASAPYASGNVVGTLMTFTGATQTRGTGFVQGAWLNFKSAQTATTWLWLFNAIPSNSTITDKSAFSLNAADYNKVIGVIVISGCFSATTPSICQAMGGATPISIPAGTSTLYGVLETQGTPTFGSTSDVQANLQIIQDVN